MLRLTRRAMTQFAIQRLTSTELVLDFPAVAVGFVLDVKVLVLLMHPVRRALFPFRDASCFLATGLVLVLVLGHFEGGGGERGRGVSREVRSEEAGAGEGCVDGQAAEGN
jgi:hypothetical protein